MAAVRMTREPNIELQNPTLSDVAQVMRQMLDDDGEPLAVLSFGESPRSGKGKLPELWIARLNDGATGAAVGWLVRHLEPSAKRSVVLAASTPKRRFQSLELFGVIEEVRPECVVWSALVENAVTWFVENGTPDPSLIWLDFLGSVRAV